MTHEPDLVGDFRHDYITTDAITGEVVEVDDTIDTWAAHGAVRNSLWDRWVANNARRFLETCLGAK